MMAKDDYAATQAALLTVAELIGELDLKSFLETIARAHAIAPMIDPTLYRRGAGSLGKIEALAFAALVFQKAAGSFQERPL